MRWAGLALTGLLLVGCADSSGVQSPSIGRQPTAVAASSIRGSSPQPVFEVGFSCRLPVTSQNVSGGFITFPAGSFAGDPAGQFVFDANTTTFKSTTQPSLVGSDPILFYDSALSRWFPSERRAVNQEMTSYAYVSHQVSSQEVHIVDVASSREQAFPVAHPFHAGVFDYSPNGIYLAGVGDAAETGLWLMDPQTGSERLLTGEKIVEGVREGQAWLVQGGIFQDTLVELDLATGSKTVWFHRDLATVELFGLTSEGLPVVTVREGSTDQEMGLVRSPGTEEFIYLGLHQFDFAPTNDSHGIWFGSPQGIYLYSEASGLQKVSNQPGYPANGCF